MGSFATVLVLLIGLLVVIGAAVKIYDVKRKREIEAVHLQAQVSDALLRDSTLYSLAVTPTAHVPWSGTPARLEISGRVTEPRLREHVLQLAEKEAQRIRPDVVVVDRLRIEDEAKVARVA
ncbi:MAG TPA: hypothetical protein VHT71_20410 [Methylomirabilota bacterium]|nr:hypothetical protein [Methylomirabilota bacterium]